MSTGGFIAVYVAKVTTGSSPEHCIKEGKDKVVDPGGPPKLLRILSDAFKQLQLFRHYYNKNLHDERKLTKTNTPYCNTNYK